MFKQKDKSKAKGQKALAKIILSNEFQTIFNTKKGSVPVALGVPRAPFDSIALDSMDQLNAAVNTNTLVPSMAHSMAVGNSLKGAIIDVVTNFYNSKMSAKKAAKELVKAVKAEK